MLCYMKALYKRNGVQQNLKKVQPILFTSITFAMSVIVLALSISFRWSIFTLRNLKQKTGKLTNLNIFGNLLIFLLQTFFKMVLNENEIPWAIVEVNRNLWERCNHAMTSQCIEEHKGVVTGKVGRGYIKQNFQ